MVKSSSHTRVATRAGEFDRVIAALEKVLSTPYTGPLAANAPLTPALLRLNPMFDPLRNDPRFKNSQNRKRRNNNENFSDNFGQ